jgi:hypothetical protein
VLVKIGSQRHNVLLCILIRAPEPLWLAYLSRQAQQSIGPAGEVLPAAIGGLPRAVGSLGAANRGGYPVLPGVHQMTASTFVPEIFYRTLCNRPLAFMRSLK